MLNNITNFFNLIKTGMVKTQLEAKDVIPIGTKDASYGGTYKPTLIEYANFVAGLVGGSNGQVLFNDADTIAGASNLYWDKVNERVGIGTSTPSTPLTVFGTSGFDVIRFKSQYTANGYFWTSNTLIGISNLASKQGTVLSLGSNGVGIRSGNDLTPTAMLHVQGAGATLATSTFQLQNSSATELFRVWDDGAVGIGVAGVNAGYKLDVNGTARVQGQFDVISGTANFRVNNNSTYVQLGIGSTAWVTYNANETYFQSTNIFFQNASNIIYSNGRAIFGSTSLNARAQLQIDSTTRGFLPPRMTTTQRNAIAFPPAGLQVYDTDLNRPCFYDGTTWITL